jgi:hypothetical protein
MAVEELLQVSGRAKRNGCQSVSDLYEFAYKYKFNTNKFWCCWQSAGRALDKTGFQQCHYLDISFHRVQGCSTD